MGRKVSKQVGVLLRKLEFNEAGMADYIAKTGLFTEAKEIAHRTTKESKTGYGLRDIHREVAAGSRVWLARFKELATWFHNKKVHNRSRSLTKLLKELESKQERTTGEAYTMVFSFTNRVFREIEKKKLLTPILRLAAKTIQTGKITPLVVKVGSLLKAKVDNPDDITNQLKVLLRDNLLLPSTG